MYHVGAEVQSLIGYLWTLARLGMFIIPVVGIAMTVYGLCFAGPGSRARCLKPLLLGLGALAVSYLPIATGYPLQFFMRRGDPPPIMAWMVLLLVVDACLIVLICLYRSRRRRLREGNVSEMEST